MPGASPLPNTQTAVAHLDLLPIVRYLVICAVTVLCGLGPTWVLTPRHWRADRALLVPIFGVSFLVLVGSTLNLLGVRMDLAGRLTVGIGIAWAAFALSQHRRAMAAAMARQRWIVVAAAVAGSTVLWSVVWAQSWNPYHDAYTYISIADHLLQHSFSTPVAADPRWPGTTQVALYQNLGLRMGANFFLALATALFGGGRSFDFYLPVVGCAVFVLVFGTAVVARRLFFLKPATTLMAAWLYGINGGIVLATALLGFLPQTLGMPVFMAYLALQRAAVTGPRSRVQPRAAIGAAVLFGTLVLTYLEVAPFAGLTALIVATLTARRGGLRAVARSWVVCAATAVAGLLLVPMSALKAPTALIVQAGVVVGMDPKLGVVDYLFVLAGLTPWWRHAALRPGLVYTLGRALAVAIPVVAVWAWLRAARATRLQMGTLLLLASTFTFVFAGAASNPFDPSVIGQPWSTLKIVSYYSWLYAMFVAVAIATLLRGTRWQRAGGAALLVGLSTASVGLAVGVARWAAQDMRATVGSATPLVEYRRLPALVADAGATGVNLVMDAASAKHRQWVAYFLGVPVTADWSDDVYIWPHLPPDQRRSAPTPGLPTLTYAPGTPGAIAGMAVAAGALTFQDGWYGAETDGAAQWRWLEQTGRLSLFLPRAGAITLRGDVAIVGGQHRTVTIEIGGTAGGRLEKVLPEQWFTPATFGPIDLPAGVHDLTVSSDGAPGRLGPGDPRSVRLGLRNPSVSVAPSTQQAVTPAAARTPTTTQPALTFGKGWHGAESDGTAKWHWLEGPGQLGLRLTADAAVTLQADLAVVGNGSRTITLVVDGPSPGRITRAVPEQWFTPVDFGPLQLRAGDYVLTLDATGPPSALGPADARRVRVGLRNPRVATRAYQPREPAIAVGASPSR